MFANVVGFLKQKVWQVDGITVTVGVLIVIVVLLVFGIGAKLADRRRERAESISDAQTTSEKGLW